MSDLQDLETWAQPLLAKLSPAERRKLARTVAQQLRQTQRTRIAAQQNPDGSPFEPRKPQNRQRKGFVRRGAMFSKIRQATHLRVRVTDSGAEVGFFGRVAQIARVHQYGLRDHVTKSGTQTQYPQRELLGFSDSDRVLIRDLLIDHLT
ncbi:MAG: phage virion morphogenesis protein [Pseudohongiella sp.]|nr:phage virion morphogenesis protein [Pseudohongiella sp.]